MGHRSTLSGHIQELYYATGTNRDLSRLWHHNRQVIRSLPANDPWPFLSRRMLGASPIFGSSDGRQTNTYRGPVIYFGGSFSSLHDDLAQWRAKFEALLSRLYWEQAVVVLVTEWAGQYVYRWKADLTNFSADHPTPILQWTVTGGAADF